MFKRILLSSAFVGALAIGGLGVSSNASAAHFHYGVSHSPYHAAYARRSAYAHHHFVPAPRSYYSRSAYYAGPSCRSGGYYGGYAPRSAYYSRGPAFRLSIGF